MPEPNDFDVIIPHIPMPTDERDAVVVKGVLPSARIHSLSLHAGVFDTPTTADLHPIPGHEDTREYEVEIRRGDGAVGESVSPRYYLILVT